MIKKIPGSISGRSIASSLAIALLLPAGAASAAPPKKGAKAARPAAAPAAPQPSTSGRGKALDIQRAKSALPQSQAIAPDEEEKKARSLEMVKPPRSSELFEGASSKEAEYERLLNEEIKTLFRLSRQTAKSPNRGEVWLRLAERYVEKARLVEYRAQAEYDNKLKEFLAKKNPVKPKLDTRASHEYHLKSVQLYEWFVRDFPQDPKMDQALFFLGYNQFELGNTKQGEKYYQELIAKFPDSVFVTESHFALGEFYFENEDWKNALENYAKVVKVRKARLNTFALYKSSWCLYRLNRVKQALLALERVIRMSRAGEGGTEGAGRRQVNKLRLASEALKDYVPFYAEVGDPKTAHQEFERLAGEEKLAQKMIERLAFIYADQGNRAAANYMFKKLIGFNPSAEKAAEYQYQVVLAYATYDQKIFRKELDIWLENFGPGSYWAKDNAKNQKLVADVANLQETTLRNHVLQLHQAAQNSRAPFSQQLASTAYQQYFKHFSNAPKVVEMQFFHAELLYDMGKYEDAARFYTWVAEKEPQGPYREKAIVNTLLALEKTLPSVKEIDEKRGKSLEKIPLDPSVARFEKAAIKYIQTFPKGEKVSDIQRRLGVLYYGYNHFEEAVNIFEKILQDNPKSDNAEVAGNLILDIFKLKGDLGGFAEKAQQLLANPAIAKTKLGAQIRPMLQKAAYIKAEKVAEGGDHLKAAKEFETYATANAGSELGAAARVKAALSYEKGGDFNSAIRMYNMVIATPSSDPKIKAAQNDARNSLAKIYQQTGQLDLAAKQYQAYAAVNPKDPKSVNAVFNSAVLWESLGETNEAMRAYQNYAEMADRKDKVEVLFTQAEMLRKKGQFQKPAQLYEQYLNSGPGSQVKAITSMYYLAQITDKQGNDKMAKRWYSRTLAAYKDAPKSVKDETVKFAAEARFIAAQETLDKLMAVRFGSKDKEQARAANEVKALREKYMEEMKDVIRFDNAPFIVAALASSGKMFDGLANLFAKIPVPSGFAPEEAAKYKELIQVQVNNFKTEAKNSYKAAVDKSQELEAYTNWTRIALNGLAAHDPAASMDAGELATDTRAADWMGM